MPPEPAAPALGMEILGHHVACLDARLDVVPVGAAGEDGDLRAHGVGADHAVVHPGAGAQIDVAAVGGVDVGGAGPARGLGRHGTAAAGRRGGQIAGVHIAGHAGGGAHIIPVAGAAQIGQGRARIKAGDGRRVKGGRAAHAQPAALDIDGARRRGRCGRQGQGQKQHQREADGDPPLHSSSLLAPQAKAGGAEFPFLHSHYTMIPDSAQGDGGRGGGRENPCRQRVPGDRAC